MKKLKQILVLLTLFIVSCLLLACARKGDTNQTHGREPAQTILWNCEYAPKSGTYDVDAVSLRFSFGRRAQDAVRRFYTGYFAKKERAEELQNVYDGKYDREGYPPVPIHLFFLSFGHRYRIRTVDDFFTSDYYADDHTETITVPAELFYNDHGLITFEYTDDEDGGTGSFTNGKTSCSFYYEKEGKTVQISSEDFLPTYEYRLDVLNGDAENVECNGFGGQDPATQDYCAYIVRIPEETRTAQDDSDYQVEFFFGRIYDETECVVPSVDVVMTARDGSGERETVVRTINDYMSDQYLCDRAFDYYGNIKEVIYTHSETINIPHTLFSGESGSGALELAVREMNTENKLSSIVITYSYEYKKLSDDRFLEIRWG